MQCLQHRKTCYRIPIDRLGINSIIDVFRQAKEYSLCLSVWLMNDSKKLLISYLQCKLFFWISKALSDSQLHGVKFWLNFLSIWLCQNKRRSQRWRKFLLKEMENYHSIKNWIHLMLSLVHNFEELFFVLKMVEFCTILFVKKYKLKKLRKIILLLCLICISKLTFYINLLNF